MIQTTHTCAKCNSPNIIKNGHNRSGSPQYKCKDCGTCRVLVFKGSTAYIDLDALERTYRERNSYRATGRIFGISDVTVMNLLTKKGQSATAVQDEHPERA